MEKLAGGIGAFDCALAAKFREQFIEGAHDKGLARKKAEELFGLIRDARTGQGIEAAEIRDGDVYRLDY